jgi:hypothetical protein
MNQYLKKLHMLNYILFVTNVIQLLRINVVVDVKKFGIVDENVKVRIERNINEIAIPLLRCSN